MLPRRSVATNDFCEDAEVPADSDHKRLVCAKHANELQNDRHRIRHTRERFFIVLNFDYKALREC
jgi:hypothetical protein